VKQQNDVSYLKS